MDPEIQEFEVQSIHHWICRWFTRSRSLLVAAMLCREVRLRKAKPPAWDHLESLQYKVHFWLQSSAVTHSPPGFGSYDRLPQGREVTHRASFVSGWLAVSQFFLFTVCAFAKCSPVRAKFQWPVGTGLCPHTSGVSPTSPVRPLFRRSQGGNAGKGSAGKPWIARFAIQLNLISCSFSRARCHSSKA